MRTIILPHSVTEILRRRKEDAISQWVFPDLVKLGDSVDPNAAYRHMKTLSAMLGHVSAATTLDIYTHITDDMRLIVEMKLEIAEAFDGFGRGRWAATGEEKEKRRKEE